MRLKVNAWLVFRQDLRPVFGTVDEGKPDVDEGMLPCIAKLRCSVEYGTDPLDIARFGVLPHCREYGLARCIVYVDDTGVLVDHRHKMAALRTSYEAIEQILVQNGIVSQPARVYVNENGTLVVDGGSPLVFLPPEPTPSTGQLPVQPSIPVQQPDPIPVQQPDPIPVQQPDPILSPSPLNSPLFKVLNNLQTFTQSVLSDENEDVDIIAYSNGRKPVSRISLTKSDFLSVLSALSRFEVRTL